MAVAGAVALGVTVTGAVAGGVTVAVALADSVAVAGAPTVSAVAESVAFCHSAFGLPRLGVVAQFWLDDFTHHGRHCDRVTAVSRSRGSPAQSLGLLDP